MTNTAILPATSVEVLFWEGSTFQKLGVGNYTSGPSFGHVAIKTTDEYISFWPGRCGQEGSKHCQQITSHFHDYDKDLKIEGRPPKPRIQLDSLDVTKINVCFNKFKKGNYAWKIFGSSSFSKPYERNCAGLCLYLLEAGNIRELVPGAITKDPKTTFAILSISAVIFGALCYGSYRTLSPLLNAREICSICNDNYRVVSNFDIEMNQNITNLIDQESQFIMCFSENILEELTQVNISRKMSTRENERNHSLIISALSSLVDNVEMRSIMGIGLTTIGLLGYFTFTGNKALIQTVTPADVRNLAFAAKEKEQRKNEKTPSSFSWKVPAFLVAGIGSAFFIYLKTKGD